MVTVRFSVPLRLPSLTNVRWHWRKVANLKRRQKDHVFLALRCAQLPLPRPPLTVTITRVGPRRLDDDNLAASCKYVRDAIAAAVGVDDGSAQYTWRYEQRVGKYGVEVEIEQRG